MTAERVVLFLGAGASKDFGYPLTSEIFPTIRDELPKHELFPLASNRKRELAKTKRLTDYLTRLLPSVFDEDVTLPLITDVLSLVDLLLETGEVALPKMSTAELEDLRTLLEEAVIQVIDAGHDEARTDPALDRLTDWLLGFAGDDGPPATVVSTNYDTLVESVLYEKLLFVPEAQGTPLGEVVDLGVSWREHATGKYLETVHHPPVAPRVRVLKLHGSLSWLKCPLCGFIYVNTTGNIVEQAFREDKIDYNNTCVCGHGPVRAILVAPSMVRSVRDPNLLTIWRSALEALRKADEWIVAGYSLPPEDIAIRSILIRGYHARAKQPPPRIRVIQPKADPVMEGRYRLLFPDCEFEYGGFKQYTLSLPQPKRHYALPD
jgi:hypothetical protein